MFTRINIFARLLAWPLRALVRSHVITAPLDDQANTQNNPLFYITKVASASDLATLRRVCLAQGYPEPTDWVMIGSQQLPRTLFLETPHSLSGKQIDSGALAIGQRLLQLHFADPQ